MIASQVIVFSRGGCPVIQHKVWVGEYGLVLSRIVSGDIYQCLHFLHVGQAPVVVTGVVRISSGLHGDSPDLVARGPLTTVRARQSLRAAFPHQAGHQVGQCSICVIDKSRGLELWCLVISRHQSNLKCRGFCFRVANTEKKLTVQALSRTPDSTSLVQ